MAQQRLAPFVAAAVMCLLLIACEQGEDVSIVNETDRDIVVRSGFQGRIGTDGFELAPGESLELFTSTGLGASIRASYGDRPDFFSRRYSWEELTDLGFTVPIVDDD